MCEVEFWEVFKVMFEGFVGWLPLPSVDCRIADLDGNETPASGFLIGAFGINPNRLTASRSCSSLGKSRKSLCKFYLCYSFVSYIDC
jgi:hypothetical protein